MSERETLEESKPERPKIDARELKRGAYLRQRQKEMFCLRIKTPRGMLNPEQLAKLAELAMTYGQGVVHLTARQGMEIPWVHQDNIGLVKDDLEKSGLGISASGARVRTVVCCPGTRWCPWACIDALNLAEQIEKEFYGKEEFDLSLASIASAHPPSANTVGEVPLQEKEIERLGISPEIIEAWTRNVVALPHKFRMSVSGCSNSCARAQENDIGFCGQVKPDWVKEKCNLCRACEGACPTEAIKVHPRKRVVSLDESKCIYCGLCILNCPNGAWQAKLIGLAMYAGGKWGRFPQLGKRIANFLNEKQALHAIRKTIEFYIKEAKRGERLANLLNRIGIDRLRQEIMEVA